MPAIIGFKKMKSTGRTIILAAAAAALSLAAGQISLPKPKIPGIPGLDSLLKEDPPITTSLKDAVTEVPFLDEFNPRSAVPLTVLARSNDGRFDVFPGVFSFEAQSYCMHAGTHGPGSGEGYLFAPLKGPRAGVIQGILRRSVAHPEIAQSDVQRLIWAILARTKPSKLSSKDRDIASQLISEQDLRSLEGSGWDVLKDNASSSPFLSLPAPLRQIMEAENRLRSMFYSASAPFDELERIAVLTGEYQPRKDDRPVPKGRWSYHPDGYFVRFVPHGYSHTTQHTYFPEDFDFESAEKLSVSSVTNASGMKLAIHEGQLIYSQAGAEVGRVAFQPSRSASDKRKSEFNALLKKIKAKGSADSLAAIADMVDALAPVTDLWGDDARELAYQAWMSAFDGLANARAAEWFAMVAGSQSQKQTYDPSSSVATPGETGRQRLAQSSRCKHEGSGDGESGDGGELKKAVIDAMRAKGYDVGPDNVYVYDQRDSKGLLRFVVRMSRDNKPLPTGECINERIAAGEVPPGSLEGAKEMLFGSVQFAGTMKRVAVRSVDVETGVITGAGKGDGSGIYPATNNAFQNYRRW